MSTRSECPGESKRSVIPLIEPYLRGNEWEYVRECVETGWVSSVGKFVDRFEAEFAAWLGSRNAVAVSSGTAALHLALIVAGVRSGDTVIVPTLTFIAPVNAIRYCGAKPAFIDSEPDYWQMDVAQVEQYLTSKCGIENGEAYEIDSGSRVSAILPVHILGHPVDMDPLLSLAEKYQLRVIEDATESLGASYKGTKAGLLGDIACFSFNGNKLITTGGGGMLVSKEPRLAERARHLSTQAKADALEYIHDEVGYNYRLTNIQAALGCAQLEQLDALITAKHDIRILYEQSVEKYLPGVKLQATAKWAQSANWLNSLCLTHGQGHAATREVIRRMLQMNITTRALWQPAHCSPSLGNDRAETANPVALHLFANVISLPSSVGLEADKPRRIVQALAECVAPATRVSFRPTS